MALSVMREDGFYGWVNLAVASLFMLVSGFLMISFGLFLPFWVEEFAWNRGLISGAQTLNLIIMGLIAPLVGIFIMKHGGRLAIVVGNLLSVAGLGLLAFHSHLWQLYLGFGAMIGIGFSLGGMLAVTTIINNWFVIKRSLALSIAMASMGVGAVIMMPVLMALINNVGWRNTYLIVIPFLLVFCVILPGLLLRNKPEDLGQVPDGAASQKHADAEQAMSHKNLYRTPVDFTAKEALRTPALWLLVGYGTFQMLTMNALMTHQISFLFDIGISSSVAAVAMGLMGGMSTISQLCIGFMGLRFNMRSLAIVAMILVIIGMVLVLFARTLPMVLLFNTFLGLGFGVNMVAMMNLFPNYFGTSEFPKIIGYTMPFNTLIGSVGAPVAGFIREATGSYLPAFQIGLVVILFAFVCIVFARPPVHPSLRKKRDSEL